MTWQAVLAGALLLAGWRAQAGGRPEAALSPRSVADYGSGAATYGLYYPGGVPDLGLFVGQANPYHRNDRALVRFRVAPYLLSGQPVAFAELCFEVGSFTAEREESYVIEITHLAYDVTSFSAADLVNTNGRVVGTVTVRRQEYAGRRYSLAVTRWVNADLAAGNLFTAFRFRNITAEISSTGKTGIMLGEEITCKPLPVLKLGPQAGD